MKKIIITILLLFGFSFPLFPQVYDKDREREEQFLPKEEGIQHRAGGIHNAGNIGLFFENRGKLYPRRLSQGPSGEFPINSGKHYIYRINPMVGIPGNVIQGRYTTNEEWEAVGGYHNEQLARIAFSDNPNTWHPVNGWHLKDSLGNPVFKSDQDSYAVFSDSNNTKEVIGIVVAQTGYTYGVKFAQNIIFYKYEVTNQGNKDLDSLYFAMYCDIDVGNNAGTSNQEYGDDKIGFDKGNNFLYFYDAKGFSRDWNEPTGYFGVTFLRTPEINGVEPGITDMHYNLYFDDIDDDNIQFGIMSSSRSLYESPLGSKYFHIGNNPTINYDDPATIPNEGLDIVATISSGPYFLKRGDTLVFYTAIIAGNDLPDAMNTLSNAQRILEFDFEISKPPATPLLTGIPGDNETLLFWDDKAESSIDNFSGEFDFEGYRLYRSKDRGNKWDIIADFDIRNQIGADKGLQHSFRDTTVINGFEYWYTVTSYDRGDESVESLESPKGNTIDAMNTVSLTPLSNALGRNPVSAGDVEYIGSGKSNYIFSVDPADIETLGGNEYEVGFNYTYRVEKGKLRTKAEIIITDSSLTIPNRWGFQFLATNRVSIIDLATDEALQPDPKAYSSGNTYNLGNGLRVRLFDPDPTVDPEFKAKAGDYITINFSTHAVKNGIDTVIKPRPYLLDVNQTTSDGVIFSMKPPAPIQNISRIGGTDNVEFTFSVSNENELKNETYIVSITGRGTNNTGQGFVSVEVKNSSNSAIRNIDSLYTLDSFTFNGVRGRITFPGSNPPSAGNVFSLSTVLPVKPNVKDRYKFGIKGSTINKEEISKGMNNIKVVPNPYVVSSLYEPEFGQLRREPLRQIQFINLPRECTIYIFTLAADLVKKIDHNGPGGTAVWDLRADGGREIAAGIYIYVVKTENEEFLNRFAVIK